MRSIFLVMSGVIVGAVGASGIWMWMSPPSEHVSLSTVASDASVRDREGTITGGGSDESTRLDAVERQLERLTAAVESLGETSRAPLRVPSKGEDVPLDTAALAAALDQAQEERKDRRLESLTEEQLLHEARRLRRDDPLEAERAIDEMLGRSLSPIQRTQALTQLGLIRRRAGDLADAERVLQEAATLSHGTDEGAWATYELATTVAQTGAMARALTIVENVGAMPGISDWNRLHAEWFTAQLTEQIGHGEAARIQYERILLECQQDEEWTWLAKKAEARLESLR